MSPHEALVADRASNEKLRKRDDVYQRELDEIASRQRGNSPKFPTIAEALARRQRERETIAARTLLFGIVAGLVYKFFSGSDFGYVCAAFSFVGFVTICFVAGSRETERNGRD